MTISKWLDKKESAGIDVSQIVLPDDLVNDEAPEQTIYFKEINHCGILCTGSHPFSTVERYGHWYCSRGLDKGMARTPQSRSGGCLPETRTWRSKQQNHILKKTDR